MISSLQYVVVVLHLMSAMVQADRMIRFVFNDGIPPTPSNECTVSDLLWIDPLFNITANLRGRKLQEILASDIDVADFESSLATTTYIDGTEAEEEHFHRNLATYPERCKDNCAGYVRGTCRATGCVGYRRTLQDDVDAPDPNRRELATCDVQVAGIHAALDLLIITNKVSSSCKTFLLKPKRKAECFDDVIYGEILSFTFYNLNWYNRARPPGTWGIIKENASNGIAICSKIPVNMEVVLNPCVKEVNFTMTGPNNLFYGRIDDNHPMLLFNTTVHAATFGGQFLSPGNYSLRAVPDKSQFKEKKLDFRVLSTC